jgi:hypothetical protein
VTLFMDPNKGIALSLARGLAQTPLPLPAALTDVQARATFIREIDKPLLVDANGVAQWQELGAQLRAISQASAEVMPELAGELDRVAIALMLWSGCITAAKAIAFETRSGKNTIAGRAQEFAAIDSLAAQDALFCAGVEAAPAFKTQRGQTYSLEGVPQASPVHRYISQAESGSERALG